MRHYQFNTTSLICFATFGLLLGAGFRLAFCELMAAAPNPDAMWNVVAPVSAILLALIYGRTNKMAQITNPHVPG